MIHIDGSFGEGGGQIVRSSLALSLVTGEPFRIENVRARRSKPGLLRQHLTAVKAAAEIGQAEVEGAELGSRELTFQPGETAPGEYRFSVGTAGSATLVFQAVLPALLTAGGPSKLILEGGTHNPAAPPFDHLQTAFLPLLARMGPRVNVALIRPGFFPAGGGRFEAAIQPPQSWRRIDLPREDAIRQTTARAMVAQLPGHIAERELEVIIRRLELPKKQTAAMEITGSHGPGNVVMVEIARENLTELFTGFGQRGVKAEDVAKRLVRDVKKYFKSAAPVGPHLADQLLLPMTLAGGGSFYTSPPTGHTTTNMEVIRRFIKAEINAKDETGGVWRIEVEV